MITEHNKKIAAVFTLALCLCLLCAAAGDLALKCADIRANTLRLHILANSDSEGDQELKLKLRDALLAKYSYRLSGEGAAQAAAAASEACGEMRLFAESFIREQGYSYSVSVSVVEMGFTASRYESFTMPPGRYTALRFELGEAKGKNWWCVMYPPLCIPATGGEEAQGVKERISALNAQPVYKPALALLEAAQRLYEAVSQHSDQQSE